MEMGQRVGRSGWEFVHFAYYGLGDRAPGMGVNVDGITAFSAFVQQEIGSSNCIVLSTS